MLNFAKKNIQEIYWIRAIACLSVVLIHAITRTIANYELPTTTVDFFRSIQMVIMFATPMFVLISVVVLANVYQRNLPNKFFQNRFLYLFLPYVFTPVIYTIFYMVTRDFNLSEGINIYKAHVLEAGWHGYFIVIIFQFFILYAIFVKFLRKVPAWIMLGVSFVINVYYLYYINFLPDEVSEGLLTYSRLPFFGWIFYFTIAFYFGRNLEKIRKYFKTGILISLVGSIAGLLIVQHLYHSTTLTVVSSLRLDIMFYTIFVFFFLFYAFSKVRHVPKVVHMISKYSFSIYLLHMLTIEILDILLPHMNIGVYTLLMFVLGVVGSIFMAFIISKIPLSQFVIGKIRPVPTRAKRVQEKTADVA